ncbi:LysR family transcriptional regulator [Vibrio sp.]|uniref:LysR family transcriptional regulator n=1 Tax=Vibrio viridaestus TaxID=2487322 RepID=A0A3N9TKA0_9VIBR|nr:LysR family transcriptional regulator [Vibrio viridaestus]MDC0611345.1 LysR family transcriptional regulator [Vibrio sp.]RQW64253.1 LysR family transcriptional regulator [Vibrio viridaestus]
MKSNYSIDDLYYFCTVAQLSSFKLASKQLGIPLSTLSRRIHKLENDMQIRLLNRDSHRVTLTHTGERYFQRYKELFDEFTIINEDLHGEKHTPRGKIRVTAPLNASHQYLREMLFDFMELYPDIQIDIQISSELIDIESEGIDIAFRVGRPILTNWISRPLLDIHFVLCSSPDLDTQNIRTPEDLHQYPCCISRPMAIWELVNEASGDVCDFQPSSEIRIESNDIQIISNAISRGFGIGYIPDYYVQQQCDAGVMKRVLPDWKSKPRRLFMMYKDRVNMPLRVRLLIDYILENLKIE